MLAAAAEAAAAGHGLAAARGRRKTPPEPYFSAPENPATCLPGGGVALIGVAVAQRSPRVAVWFWQARPGGPTERPTGTTEAKPRGSKPRGRVGCRLHEDRVHEDSGRTQTPWIKPYVSYHALSRAQGCHEGSRWRPSLGSLAQPTTLVSSGSTADRHMHGAALLVQARQRKGVCVGGSKG